MFRVFIVVLSVFFCGQAAFADMPEGMFHPKVKELPNGLQIVVVENDALPVVKAMIWYKVGAADETVGQSGIAHFLEHLMFKGTDKVANGQLSKEIAAVGGMDNAFTSWDYTAYHATIPPSFVPRWLELEADRMIHAKITDDVVRTERGVIIEERRMRVEQSPEAKIGEQLRVSLFANHPYNTPVIGWKKEIEGLTTQQINDFYKKWYAPNNAILAISGQVKAEDIFGLADKYFGHIPASETKGHKRVRPAMAPLRGQTIIHYADARISKKKVSRYYRAPSFATATGNDAYAYMLLAELLSGSVSSPIYQQLVLKEDKAYGAYAYYDGESLDNGSFVLGASLKDDETQEDLEQELAQIVVKFSEKTPEELAPILAQVKAKLFEETVFSLDNVEYPARTLGEALSTGETVDDIENWKQTVDAVTAEDVLAVAKKISQKKAWVSLYLSPEKKHKEMDAVSDSMMQNSSKGEIR